MHIVVASLLVFFLHIFTLFYISVLQITNLSPVVGFGFAYLYFRVLKVEGAVRKALLSTLIGTALFYASCFYITISIAPALMNM
jgi:hypothetical protein